MSIFFISDLHLGHKNIIKYCNRPFDSVEQMNEALISNWNQTVTNEDKVFLLGDFALSSKDDIIKWGRALNGNKVLILGNHDRGTLKTYYEAGFKEVVKYPIFWNQEYLLSHTPLFIAGEMPITNIYGHVHNDEKYKDYTDYSFCVSIERIGYKPIKFTEIQKKVKKYHKLDLSIKP